MWSGVEPAPTEMSSEPTCELAGQLGAACAALPSLASPAESAASEQIETPASFASRPLGRVVSIDFRPWVPSGRVTFSTNGVKALTVGLIVPAEKPGSSGAAAPAGRQARPSGPAVS